MYTNRMLGFWTEYGWVKNAYTIENDIQSYVPDLFNPKHEVIEYLEKGISLVGMRMVIQCVFSGESIGSPIAKTDGKYFWTLEYMYYVEKGVIKIDNDFLQHMYNNEFQVLSRDDISVDKLIALSKQL